jgi:hypothetical protein
MHPVVWFIFNLTFIAFAQSFLLAMFSFLPAYVIFLTSQIQPQIAVFDYQYFIVEFMLVLSELISDNQQWRKISLTLSPSTSFYPTVQ